nr:Antitoxin CptB [Candidatus Pantoea persica]
MLHELLQPMGVRFVGYWPLEGYEFTSVKPLSADGQQFVGLALDDVNQYQDTDARIEQWCEQILTETAALL